MSLALAAYHHYKERSICGVTLHGLICMHVLERLLKNVMCYVVHFD